VYQYAETEPARDARLGETEPVASSCNSGLHHVHLCDSDYNEGHLNYEFQDHQMLLKQALWEKNQEFQTELPELRRMLELRRMSTELDQQNEGESPHYEQQQEPPSRTHTAHEQVTEHEEAQTRHVNESGSHRCDEAQGGFVAFCRNHKCPETTED
jgi:hypothetical protein